MTNQLLWYAQVCCVLQMVFEVYLGILCPRSDSSPRLLLSEPHRMKYFSTPPRRTARTKSIDGRFIFFLRYNNFINTATTDVVVTTREISSIRRWSSNQFIRCVLVLCRVIDVRLIYYILLWYTVHTRNKLHLLPTQNKNSLLLLTYLLCTQSKHHKKLNHEYSYVYAPFINFIIIADLDMWHL